MHNVHYQLDPMRRARAAIVADRFPAFLRRFFADLYSDPADYPSWAVDALRGVGVDLLLDGGDVNEEGGVGVGVGIGAGERGRE